MPEPVFLLTSLLDSVRQGQTARSLGLEEVTDSTHSPLFLHFTDNILTLSLQQLKPRSVLSVSVDFSRSRGNPTAGKQGRELLLRAIKTKSAGSSVVVDCTGGLGRDAYLMAQAGKSVIILEQHPIIHALLADGVERGKRDDCTREACRRMTVHNREAVAFMHDVEPQCEVIYLDPMFPDRGKTGKAKQELQILQHLLPHADDACRLLSAAWKINPRKIVVKRPLKGPHLCGLAPDYTLRGKTVRYDVYLPGSTTNPF